MAAQDSTAKLVKREVVVHKTRISAYPYLYYTPETQLAFGAGGIMTFYTGESRILRPSKLTASGYYSTKGQYNLSTGPQVYLADNRVLLGSYLAYGYFIDKFWGIGGDQGDIKHENYASRVWRLQLNGQVPPPTRLLKATRVGFKYSLIKYRVADPRSNPFLAGDSIVGSEGGLSSGFGLQWVWDRRDHEFFPEKGLYLQAEALWYAGAFGSDFGYGRYKVDVRHYFRLGPERVIAAQVLGNFASGQAPFYDLPMVGGGNTLRGYYQGRWRDDVVISTQAEVRLPIRGRFGGVVFAGLAEVAPRLSAVSLDNLKFAAGGGLRFRFNQAEKVNLRADVGIGAGSSGLYFGLEEAF